MEPLPNKVATKFPAASLKRVADIAYFEGPLLTLFQDAKTQDFYLYDWVDRDDTHNRWLVYRVSPEQLMEYLLGIISHRELLSTPPKRPLYWTEIDGSGKPFSAFPVHRLSALPSQYLPDEETYFDPAECPMLEQAFEAVLAHFKNTNAGLATQRPSRSASLKAPQLTFVLSGLVGSLLEGLTLRQAISATLSLNPKA